MREKSGSMVDIYEKLLTKPMNDEEALELINTNRG
jgi:hypothetical protein